MNKIIYKAVFNRKHQLRQDGQGLVQIEAYQNRQRKYFTTRIYLFPHQWDEKHRQVRRHVNARGLNRQIAHQLHQLERVELELYSQGRCVTLELLKQMAHKVKGNDSFVDFWLLTMNRSKLRPSTRVNHASTLQLLRRFRRSLRFEEINYELVCRFEHFLLQEGYHANTVAKHLKHLKRYINQAINQERMDIRQYPFRKFRIRTVDYHHTFLTPEELARMEALADAGLEVQKRRWRDAFLFCCYTGLRYSDFCSLQRDSWQTFPDGTWLVYHTVKTGVEVHLPLYLLFDGKAVKLLERYADQLIEFFHLPISSTLNKALADMAVRAGIEKHISFHTARHTNASLLLYQGVSITTVQKLLGHKSVRTTQGYANIMDRTLVAELSQCKGL